MEMHQSKQEIIQIPEQLIRKFDTLGPRYTSYPTADRFYTDFNASSYREHLQKRASLAQKPPLSLYIHIPFCAQLCYYCACNKVITKDHGRSAKYLQYLEKELQLLARNWHGREVLSQLHLGGGTPTFLSHDEFRQLMAMLHQYFDFTEDAERSIEIDPRTVNTETLALLAELGFNRTSLGVQDFEPAVQQAVHRIQPVAMVADTLQTARQFGFKSINFDLIYGLPKQSLASFTQTLEQVIAFAPERIAVYNYAHLPSRFKPQRRIAEVDLPSAEQRLAIFQMCLQRLQQAGYVYIGLDHFAKPDDSLALACRDGSLHRNFQGYTTRADCDLIGLGLSSIGKLGSCYSQNLKNLDEYYACLDRNELPVEKGFSLDQDDQMRREIIMTLMCSNALNFADFERNYQIDFQAYFGAELSELSQYVENDLLTLDRDGIRVTAIGRLFVRGFAMVFDRYLKQRSQAQYSKII